MGRSDEYLVASDTGLNVMSLAEVVKKRENGGDKLSVISAKEATGLMGKPGCIPGNRHKENTVLGIGEEGAIMLVEMGFIPCPECKLEEVELFRRAVESTVKRIYGLSMKQFADKKILPYDAFRVDFEKIVEAGGRLPDRLYVDEHASDSEVDRIKKRMLKLGGVQIGVYDRRVSGNFRLR